MELRDLIFLPFGVKCSKCLKVNKVSFEELQFNDEITCLKCGNVFSPNIDTEALLALIRKSEEGLANLEKEKQKK